MDCSLTRQRWTVEHSVRVRAVQGGCGAGLEVVSVCEWVCHFFFSSTKPAELASISSSLLLLPPSARPSSILRSTTVDGCTSGRGTV